MACKCPSYNMHGILPCRTRAAVIGLEGVQLTVFILPGAQESSRKTLVMTQQDLRIIRHPMQQYNS